MEGKAMRYRLTLIFLACYVGVFGQVPNTTTFTLQDVVNQVNPTTDDLVDCFADAIDCYFDPAYSGSKNSLLNFRNYANFPSVSSSYDTDYAGSVTTDASVDFCDNGRLYLLHTFSSPPNYATMNVSADIYYNSVLQFTDALTWDYTSTTQAYVYADASQTMGATGWSVIFRIKESVCTRPGGLTDVSFYYSINGTTVTAGNVCDAWSTTPGTWLYLEGETNLAVEGSDVYAGWGATNCDKVADGYYLFGGYVGDVWTWYPVYISGGKWYNQPC